MSIAALQLWDPIKGKVCFRNVCEDRSKAAMNPGADYPQGSVNELP